MKKWDAVIIIAVLLLSLTPLISLLGAGQGTVVISKNGTVLYEGPISKDITYSTPDGGNTIVVENGHVRMEAASCPDGLCLTGEATAAHPLVCLPNGVTVTVKSSGQEDGADAYTY